MLDRISLFKFSLILVLFFEATISFGQFVTNGTATDIGGGCYRMTSTTPWEVGTIFSSTTIDLSQPFTESGSMNFGNNDANGADGITFLFSTSNTAAGPGGGGIGYEGITPSFVVEYDTWVNGAGENNDPNSDHVGIQQNGNPMHGTADELTAPINLPNIEDGQDHCFTIDWDPVTMNFTMTLDGVSIGYTGDISAIMGTNNVYFGFTASTGGSVNEHVICFPNPTITPMADLTICQGETAQLEADPTGSSYNWLFDPSLSATNIADPTATPNSTTTYFVDVMFNCAVNPLQTDDVTVTVIPSPSGSASNNGPICIGGSLQLNSSGGTSYQWAGPSGFNSMDANPNINNVTLLNGGPYSVTITGAGGCTTVESTFVTVISGAVATITPPISPICEGGASAQLTATPPGGVWGGVASSDGTVNPAFLTAGSYQVTYVATDANGCPASDEIMIDVLAAPIAGASLNGTLCEGSDLMLMGTGGTSYSWTGPNNFTSGDQNPILTNIQASDSGTYFLTVVDGNGCSSMTGVNVSITPTQQVAIDPVASPLCQSANPIQLTANPIGGDWSGAADASGLFDPSQFPPNTFQTVIYTLTDFNGCTSTDEIMIAIAEDPNVFITPAGPFCDSDPTQSLTASPANGTWGGVANANGEIEPQTLGEGTYEVTYSFTDANGCMGMASEFIQILAGTSPQIISTDPWCMSDDPQFLDATPTGGTWGGVADASGQVIPGNLSAGFHEVTYSVTPQGSCAGSTSVFIEILENPSATISGMGTICTGSNNSVDLNIDAVGASPIQITYAIDGTPQPVINVSNGNNVIPATEAGTYTILNVLDANGCVGIGNGMADIQVVDAPQVINFNTECDLAQENYTVTFEIIGGDPASYEVISSINGVLTGSTYESDPIPSGEAYDFLVFDMNACDTIDLSGSFNCLCLTSAGTMNLDQISLCEGEEVNAVANGDEFLDGNDALIFILHDGNGNNLGNILDMNAAPNFSLIPPMMTGVTYYISAVAGDDDGSGNVDLDDTCLSVSFGTPVQWQPTPEGTITEDAAICEGEEATIVFNLTGNTPFDVVYSFDGQNDTLNGIFSGHFISVAPSVTTTYELIEISDSSSPTCSNMVSSTITITVNEHFSMTETAQICEGDSILLGGEMQNMAGVYVDTFSTINGCDSIVFTNLMVNPIDTMFLTDTDCNMANVGTFVQTFSDQNNCDSVVILTVTFSDTDTTFISNPTCDPDMVGETSMTIVTPQGCDSVIIETLFLVGSDTTELSEPTCNPDSVGVFETILMNQGMCDSTIILTVFFEPLDTTFITDTTCDSLLAGVFTNVIVTDEGCDSVVVETISLLPSNLTEITESSCHPDSVGVFETVLENEFGCDSTVILTVTFIEIDTIFAFNTTCNPDSVGEYSTTFFTPDGCENVLIETFAQLPLDTTEIFDTTCNINDAGIFETILPSSFGCDSTIILTVIFEPIDTTFLQDVTCNPSMAGTFANTIVTNEGCDSTIVTVVDFEPIDTTFLQDSTCDPALAGVFTEIIITNEGCDSVIVETIILDPSDMTEVTETTCDPNEAGVFEEVLMNQFGCDSVVTTTVTLLQSDITNVPLTSCEPLDTGTVIIILMNQFGCDSTVITTTSLLPPDQCGVEGTLAGSLIDCDESVGTLTLEITTGEAPFSYTWTGPNSGMSMVNNLNEVIEIPNLAAGGYFVEITDVNGFMIILTAEIEQIFPPNASATVLNDVSCFNEMDGSAIASATGGQFPYNFVWSTNETTADIQNLFPGNYSVTVTDANECTDEASIVITEPTALEMTFIISNIDCFGTNEGSVEAAITGGQAPYEFSINGGEFGDNSTFFGLTAGAYTIVGQDANGCTITEGFAINAPVPLDVDLGDDYLIDLGESSELNALINYPLEALDTLIWEGLDSLECPNCPIQQVAPVITSTYAITVTADNGCSDSDELTIFVNRQKEIFAPNIFSPNGDNTNDVFYLFSNDKTVNNIKTFVVFDRWGETVHTFLDFQPNDPVSGWDGTHKGKNLNPAVYVWFASVEFEDGKVVMFKGDVVLVR